MSFLTLINNVQKRAGLEVTTNPTANANPTVKQLVALANVEGQDLALRHPWSVLQKREAHEALAAESQGTLVSIAADISTKHIRHMTLWNETTTRPITGPLSPAEWSDLKGLGIDYPADHFRIYGGILYITPAPTAGDNIAFEYISKNWCQSSGGTGQAAWAADTDTGVLDEDLMTLGVYWRFRADMGLDYAEAYADYERRVMDLINADGSKPTLSMDGGYPKRGILVGNYITRSF